MLFNLLKGISIGFSLAAPGDKIAALCVKETKKDGINLGLAAGLGASTADFSYGILTAIIINKSSTFVLGHETMFTIFSALFLCFVGLQKFRSSQSLDKIHDIQETFFKTYIKTFFMTLINKSTILEFLAIFIGLEVNITEIKELMIFVSAVFIGAALWWISLCFIAEIINKKTCFMLLRYINYANGLFLFAVAAYTASMLLE